MKTQTEFADGCSRIAERVQNLFIENLFRHDICLRYSKTDGAYVSLEDYSDNVIILRPSEFPKNLTHPQLTQYFVRILANKPFFASS